MASLELADALIGRTIAGKYIIESFLGGGAMGSVYRARQFALDKVVAIKVMRGELTHDRSFVGRFRREAKAASKLSHAHSINVTDFGEEPDGLLYIVMEFVAGRDLEQIMQEDGLPLSDLRAADILSQVLSAVAVAHDLGIVHRDLKPANFLIVASIDDEGHAIEHVKVCDFGIASMRGAEPEIVVMPAPALPGVPRPGPRRVSGNNKLTAVGALLGTPEYMSPEQASGSALGPASDIYSIGAILYELLTGQTVYFANTPEEMVLKQITNTPLHPREVRPSVNEGLATICMRALDKNPDDRYPSARAMRAELRAVLASLYGYQTQNMLSMAAPSTQPGHTSSPIPLSTLPTPSHAISGLVIMPPSRATSDTFASPETLRNESARGGGALTEPAPKITLHESGSLRAKPQTRKNRKKGLIIGLAVAALTAAAGVALVRGHAPTPTVVTPTATAAANTAVAATAAPDRTGSTTASAADVAASGPKDVAGIAAASARRPAVAGRPSATGARAAEPVPAMTMAPTAEPAQAPAIAAAAPAPAPAPTPAPTPAPKPEVAAPATPPAPVAPPFSPDGARVMASVAATNRTSRASVASVVSHTSFDSCYRDALRALGHAEGGVGGAHLEVDEDGIITNVQVRLPPPLSSATGCFVGKLRGQHVNNPDTGAATADISFSFVPN